MSTKAKKLTPMMQQFYEIKEQYPDCILFFRLGDFYEMFDQDAIDSASILDITLTARTKSADAIPMCGIPYHSAEGYILKLTHAGKKVAICEQISDPSLPGLVKRGVVRVVTPGTNISEAYLDSKLINNILSISRIGNELGLAYADISTGSCLADKIAVESLDTAIEQIQPSELVVTDELFEDPKVYQLASHYDLLVTKRRDVNNPLKKVIEQLSGDRVEGYGIDPNVDQSLIQAAANLFSYLTSTQKQDLPHLSQIKRANSNKSLHLDAITIQNLELFFTQRDQNKRGSLFATINRCVTKSGVRTLANWLVRPLAKLDLILDRQDKVEYFNQNSAARMQLREQLKATNDLQRLVGRIALNRGTPRDLMAIRSTLTLLPNVQELLKSCGQVFAKTSNDLPMLKSLLELLNKALSQNPPALISDLGIVADGYSNEVDELRALYENSTQILNNFLEAEKTATQIPNLKISSNKVVGFYIEVSKGKVDLVPDHYITKQTLTNCNRYITPELKAYEEKLLTAEANLKQIEQQICQELFAKVVDNQKELNLVGGILSKLDCWSALAELAAEKRYVKPHLNTNRELKITDGRHPVIESLLETGEFIPNSVDFNDDQKVIVLTGPNMGGKSTYLRQTALIVLLAHIGSFVPAVEANVPLTDRIFTRVGASDNLSKGQSTFMVEMQELAVILNHATANSLLLIDEIGRGTSTYDGISVAWSTLEFIHNKIDANTLFATHYHELIEVANKLKSATNYSMAVHEDADTVTFLHKVKKGGMNDSYGIEVAKRAGVPNDIVEDAQNKLKILESGQIAEKMKKVPDPNQLGLFNTTKREHHPLISKLKKADLNQMTPLQALQKLAEWQSEL